MSTGVSPGTPLQGGVPRRGDEIAKLQRKLQRSYQEKNMLLAEIQMLKSRGGPGQQQQQQQEQQQQQQKQQQQQRQQYQQAVVTATLAGESAEDKEHWNRLLEANIKTGTMACVWCMKSQVVKMLAGAFHRWHLNASLAGGVRGSNSAASALFRPIVSADPAGFDSGASPQGSRRTRPPPINVNVDVPSALSSSRYAQPEASPLQSRRELIRKSPPSPALFLLFPMLPLRR